jgi:hypothetical protein
VARTPLGVRGVAAEAAIARLCTTELPALELFERVAERLHPVVPYAAGCWKPQDPETLLFTGFAIEDPEPGTLRSVAWRFVDNELLEPDFAKFRELVRRPQPVTTLHRASHGEPERSARYRRIHRALGFVPSYELSFEPVLRAGAAWRWYGLKGSLISVAPKWRLWLACAIASRSGCAWPWSTRTPTTQTRCVHRG